MNSFRHPVIECDLLVAFVLILYPDPQLNITFGHVSRSCIRLESGFSGKPFAPAVGGTAANVNVFFYPRTESAILLYFTKVIACALSAELLA